MSRYRDKGLQYLIKKEQEACYVHVIVQQINQPDLRARAFS